MRPKDLAEIARTNNWSKEDCIVAAHSLLSLFIQPDGPMPCYVCGGDRVWLGKPCKACN
jgi:hypothetical protein